MSPSLAALRTGATLVAANARLTRQIRFNYDQHCAAEGHAFWEAADVLPWPSWLERCWHKCVMEGNGSGQVLLSPAQEEILWERIIDRADADGLLDASGAAVQAMNAYRLLQSWELSLSDPEFHLFEDPAAFHGWAVEFERILKENCWVSGAHLSGEVACLIEKRLCAAPQRLILAGFDEFTPAEQRLLRALQRAGSEIEQLTAPAIVSTVSRVGMPDAKAELAFAARWARRRLRESPKARIGVVVPDLTGMRAAAERIFDDILHPSLDVASGESRRAFHVSTGPCLTEIPVIAAAFTILSLGRNALTSREISVLLRSPFLSGATAEQGGRALLDSELRGKGFYEIGLGELARMAERLAPELAHRLRSVNTTARGLPDRQGASAWSRTFSRLLRAAGWPGDRTPNGSEQQAIERWNDLLSDFAPVELVAGPMECHSALGQLRSMAAKRPSATADEGAAVQIMGVGEAAGSTFEYLWVAGLEDRAWPPPPRPNPFLPAPLQRAHNLPHACAERELAWAREATSSLLNSAREVIVSYPQRDADTDLRPSPLILGLPEVEMPDDGPDWLHTIQSSGLDLEVFDDSKGPAVPEGTKQRGGTGVIERQAACPFRAFAEYRLGARALEEPSIGLTLQERGQAVHLALKNLWGELKSHAALVACTDTELSLLIGRSVRRALVEQVRDRGAASMPYMQSLEQRRLESLLTEWLQNERRRTPFDVVACEDMRSVCIAGLDLDVKVDRVDALADGRQVIIDYKTGDPKPNQWEGDRPDSPQLPLYAATHPKRLAAVAFARLAPGECGFKGLGEDAGIPGVPEYSSSRPGKAVGGTLTSHIQDWSRTLEQLAQEFRMGNANVAPKRNDTCEHCPLPAFCRIAEAGDRVETEETDG